MQQYLLSLIEPAGSPPPPEVLEPILRDVEAVKQELKAAGAWVFGGGLHPPSTATVVKVQHGDVLLTDGPFVESKEHIVGFVVIQVPDREAALAWARKLAQASTVPIELRPFQWTAAGR